MATSNTKEVFREAVGKKIVGLYSECREIAGEIIVLVLDDGTGLAFGRNGSHWTVTREEVRNRARQRQAELENVQRDLRDVMALEGMAAGRAPTGGDRDG